MLTHKYFLCLKILTGFLGLVLTVSSCSTAKKTAASKTRGTDTEESEKNSFAEKKMLQSKYATLLDVPVSEISNFKLYAFIDEWMNVPYKYAGKSKSGIDCSGFCSVLYRNVYGKNISGTASEIFAQCNEVNSKNLKEGDFVFFKINTMQASHVGIYLANNKFLHASTQKGVIISDLNEAYYKKYFFKGGRII